VLGFCDGLAVGPVVGPRVGLAEGPVEGVTVGLAEGPVEGDTDGPTEGDMEGDREGDKEGGSVEQRPHEEGQRIWLRCLMVSVFGSSSREPSRQFPLMLTPSQ
jgi:hypothetical protein